MRKFIKKSILITILITFLVFPAYSESHQFEKPIIIIAAGAPMPQFGQLIERLERANIKADVLYDLNARIQPYFFTNSIWGEIESGKYKTAVFIFSALCSDYPDPDSVYQQILNVEEVIQDLKDKVTLCQQNDIRMVGIQFYSSSKYFTSKSGTLRVIDEIVPYMDSLMSLYNSGDFPELGDKFIEIGKENKIPIEYFTDVESPLKSYSEAISVLSMKLGE